MTAAVLVAAVVVVVVVVVEVVLVVADENLVLLIQPPVPTVPTAAVLGMYIRATAGTWRPSLSDQTCGCCRKYQNSPGLHPSGCSRFRPFRRYTASTCKYGLNISAFCAMTILIEVQVNGPALLAMTCTSTKAQGPSVRNTYTGLRRRMCPIT